MAMLSAKKERAINALMSSPSIKEAAKAAGIRERTLHRYLEQDSFKDAWRAERERLFKTNASFLQQSCREAVEVLRSVMLNPQNKSGCRVSAAKAVLELSTRAVETVDLLGRIKKLEKILEERR